MEFSVSMEFVEDSSWGVCWRGEVVVRPLADRPEAVRQRVKT